MGESGSCVKSSPAHPKDSQWGLRSGLCGGRSMCKNDVSCSLNHSCTVWAWWIQALSSSNISVPSGKKKSIDGITWSFSIFRKSADLIFWACNVAEPRPDHNTALRDLYGRHQAWWVHRFICLSSYPVSPSLWNRVNLDTSEHLTFLTESNLHALQQIEAFVPRLASLISSSLRVHSCLVPVSLSSLRIVRLEMLLHSLLHISVGSTVNFFPI